MCERTIAEYEEELCPTKEEKERQHQLLDAVFKKHQVVLHRTDVQWRPHIEEDDLHTPHVKEEVEEPQPPHINKEEKRECPIGQEEADLTKIPLTVVSVKTEEHEDKPPESSQLHHSPNVRQLIGLPHPMGASSVLKQEEPRSPRIKEEDEEVWITQVGECPVGQEEADLTKFPLTVVSVKTEEHEDKPPESSQLHHSPNVQQPIGRQEERPPHSLEESSSLKQDEPQPPHNKEEEEELWTSEEGECPVGQEEADLTKFPLTVVSVKTEDHEDKPLESSHLHHSPNVCEEHILPEQQEWTSRIEQEEPQPPYIKEEEDPKPPHIKDEEEESQPHHNNKEKEEHSDDLKGLEEVDVTKMPVTGVPVKSEGDEVKGESEEKREAEPPSSSSTQHMTTEADGDHCGGSQADKLLAPLSDSEDTTSHSPDTDDEDSKDDKTCHTDNTHFTCSHCDKTFKYHCRLKDHMRTHTGEKPFSCIECGKSFQRNDMLKEHMRTHTGDKPFSCSECGKSFCKKGVLKGHMRIHTGDKLKKDKTCHTDNTRFKCSHCDQTFGYRSVLITHVRKHTGEKPFFCSECGKGFAQRNSLKGHMRIHTGEKLNTCSICGKTFTQKNQLKAHMTTHTGEKPFSCSVCGRHFARKPYLDEHMQLHTGERTVSCSECGKVYTQKYKLKVHMRTHTGEKVFSCSVCNERFSYGKQCKKHKCAGENSSSK
ncbi:zinc finger protein 37-like isoform X2 [Entelurus aequoreus]|uniref:zinc finger protein 37-like isoform X2 n=1 Tax=Entelurus aequoreus TaxID=161455 RepID=UPI002B1D8911|nr:zinc finger protein 37-like isoform X2 [Entelurus aequoreus]